MIKRKIYLIDKKFQLKKSIIFVSSVLILIAIVTISAGTVIAINNKQVTINNSKIIDNIKGIRHDIDTQEDKLINDLLKPVNKTKSKKISNDLIKNYNNSVDTLNASIQSNESMMIIEANTNIARMNTLLYITIIFITIAGLAVLFYLLIRQTHRISGPVFLMTRYAKEILSGGSPDMRDLREKDELKDFYVLFKQMAGQIIDLRKKSKSKKK